MITAGVDTGAFRTKAVILRDGKLLAWSVIDGEVSGVEATAKKALNEACNNADISLDDINRIAVTGVAQRYITFPHDTISDSISLALGANYFSPGTRTAVDVGAQKSLAVYQKNGIPLRFRNSEKCASGSGRYLDVVAQTMGVAIARLEEMALKSESYTNVQSLCTVFAESEIITLVHAKEKPGAIARGAFRALAQRLYGLVLQIGIDGDMLLVGGVAHATCLLKELEELCGYKVLAPDNPDIVPAVGAALAVLSGGAR